MKCSIKVFRSSVRWPLLHVRHLAHSEERAFGVFDPVPTEPLMKEGWLVDWTKVQGNMNNPGVSRHGVSDILMH